MQHNFELKHCQIFPPPCQLLLLFSLFCLEFRKYLVAESCPFVKNACQQCVSSTQRPIQSLTFTQNTRAENFTGQDATLLTFLQFFTIPCEYSFSTRFQLAKKLGAWKGRNRQKPTMVYYWLGSKCVEGAKACHWSTRRGRGSVVGHWTGRIEAKAPSLFQAGS